MSRVEGQIGVHARGGEVQRFSGKYEMVKDLAHGRLVSRGTPSEHIAMLLDGETTLVNARAAVTSTAHGTPPSSTLIVF